jgi:predicted acyltransferase
VSAGAQSSATIGCASTSSADADAGVHPLTASASSVIHERLRSPAGATEVLSAPAMPRVTSVDALRGFAMFWIIGGDGLALAFAAMVSDHPTLLGFVGQLIGGQFEHAAWEGFRFYDLLLPLFIFVTGVAIVFSLTRLVEQEGKVAAHLRVLRRFVLLYAFGLIFYGGVNESFADVRLLGVLQRIALCYLFASLLFLNCRLRGLLVALAASLLGYWALMTFVPVPGMEAASFEPGENLANWIDAQYLPGRRWNGEWDPEGILSTLPAVGTCLLGVFAGLLLRDPKLAPQQKSVWLIGLGGAMVALGLIWGLQFPIIKNLWTSSFVLVAGGSSAFLLGVFHEIIDVRGHRRWATMFVWIGASAITLYLLNGVVGFKVFAMRLVGGDVGRFADDLLGPGAGDFLSHAVGVALAVALAAFLYRRKILLRV